MSDPIRIHRPYGREAHAHQRAARQAAPFSETVLYEAQRARCAHGQHEPTTARPGYVTYAPGGRRRPEGERYCRCCAVTLDAC